MTAEASLNRRAYRPELDGMRTLAVMVVVAFHAQVSGFDGGFIGASVTQNNSLYHIPGVEGSQVGTRIDAKQTKFNAKGEYRPDAAAIDAIRFWVGATDYKHNEVGQATAGDPTTDGIRQTFTNREQEGRLEVQLMPWSAGFAAVTTAAATSTADSKSPRMPSAKASASMTIVLSKRISTRMSIERRRASGSRSPRQRKSPLDRPTQPL